MKKDALRTWAEWLHASPRPPRSKGALTRVPSAAAALVIACVAGPVGDAHGADAESLAIESTTLIDGRTGEATENVTILIQGRRVTSVTQEDLTKLPPGTRVIDGRGKWVAPGFVDVHVHEDGPEFLRRLLAAGVTTAHVMPRRPPERPIDVEGRSQSATASSPRIHLSEMFTGDFPDNLLPGVYQVRKPQSEAAARQAVRDLSDAGYRQIKIIQDDSLLWAGSSALSPQLDPEVFDALVEEAHSRGMRVYVHAVQLANTRMAIDAGADAFMHGAMDAALSAQDGERMRERGMVWTPANRVLIEFGDFPEHARRILAQESLVGWLSKQERTQFRADARSANPVRLESFQTLHDSLSEYLATLRENTRRARAAGVPVAVGSDGGPPGVATHFEMELLQEGGLSPAEALVAATHGGAVALGMEAEIGTIEPGKRADLVVLAANPLEDIRNARRIEHVIKGGMPVAPSE